MLMAAIRSETCNLTHIVRIYLKELPRKGNWLLAHGLNWVFMDLLHEPWVDDVPYPALEIA